MQISLKKICGNFSYLVLAAFFFLLALYSKQFAYLNLKVGSLPIFISECTLILVIALRANRIGEWVRIPKVPLLFLFSFLLWGFLRLGISIESGQAKEFGLFEALKQSCLFYQAVWFLVPFLFSVGEMKKLTVVSFAGVAIAQALGWFGFVLMGTYGKTYSRLIGFPVGDEVLLPLYPLVYLLLPRPWPEIFSLPYGQLWLTQFIIYMKRTWVFSVLIFALPLILWRAGKNWKNEAKSLAWPFAFSFLLAIATLSYVSRRDEPILYHRQQTESVQQRKNMPAVARGLLFLLDEVFPYTDPLATQVSIERIVFKGDLEVLEGSSTPSFMAFRIFLWRQAWAGFLERPWMGQGFGTHIVTVQLNGLPAIVDGKWISGPHNSFLTILNRMGVFGFLLFSGLLLATVFYFLRADKTDYGFLVAAAVVNLNFFSLFNVCLENPQGGIWYWLFLGLALRIACAKEEARE